MVKATAPAWDVTERHEQCALFPVGRDRETPFRVTVVHGLGGGVDPVRAQVRLDVPYTLDPAATEALHVALGVAGEMAQNMEARWALRMPKVRAQALDAVEAERAVHIVTGRDPQAIVYARNPSTNEVKFVSSPDDLSAEERVIEEIADQGFVLFQRLIGAAEIADIATPAREVVSTAFKRLDAMLWQSMDNLAHRARALNDSGDLISPIPEWHALPPAVANANHSVSEHRSMRL